MLADILYWQKHNWSTWIRINLYYYKVAVESERCKQSVIITKYLITIMRMINKYFGLTLFLHGAM
jgi:hypothetical protein